MYVLFNLLISFKVLPCIPFSITPSQRELFILAIVYLGQVQSLRRPDTGKLTHPPQKDGFTLPENPHDTLRLDAPILRRLHSGVDKEKVRLLEDAGMLGYVHLLSLVFLHSAALPEPSGRSSVFL